ncbi:MAG: TetR/AcrR family transcriptional regulator [Cyanobacteria bacterium P01_A01_bin.135]
MSNTASIDTKAQILNVAERLIGEKGFSGTTLRNIVSEAEVNLAAVHYHFGSKEELFRAVVERIAVPVVARQLSLLDQVQTDAKQPSVEDILTAFLKPPLEFVLGDEQFRLIRAQFMGRCRTEPEPIQSIAQQAFSASTTAFLDALQRALLDQSRSQLQWKLDLVIATLVRVQMEAGQPHALLRNAQPEDIQRAISELVMFLSAGMKT